MLPSSGTPNQDPTPPREDEKMKKRKNSIDDEDTREADGAMVQNNGGSNRCSTRGRGSALIEETLAAS